MDWICGFLTGCIAGCIFGLALAPSSEKITVTVNEWNSTDHSLEAEGEALDPVGGDAE